MKTNRIRLTESQLHQVIKESVQSILNEISYDTARAAYDKMIDMGQGKRASQLSKTYSDINDDEYAQYNLAHGTMKLTEPNQMFSNRGRYSRDNNHLYRTMPEEKPEEITGSYKDFTPWHRSNNLKTAQAHANHLNNFTGTNKFTRNHFRR